MGDDYKDYKVLLDEPDKKTYYLEGTEFKRLKVILDRSDKKVWNKLQREKLKKIRKIKSKKYINIKKHTKTKHLRRIWHENA